MAILQIDGMRISLRKGLVRGGDRSGERAVPPAIAFASARSFPPPEALSASFFFESKILIALGSVSAVGGVYNFASFCRIVEFAAFQSRGRAVDNLPEFFLNNQLLCMAFIAVAGALVWTFFQGRAKGVRNIDPANATRLINQENALILDVRPEAEFRQGHIVNALNLPAAGLDNRIDSLNKYRQRPVVAVCRSGQASIKAASALVAKGFENVYSLSGGILAWEGASLPLTKK